MVSRLNAEFSMDGAYTAFQCARNGQIETRLQLFYLDSLVTTQSRSKVAVRQLGTQRIFGFCDRQMHAVDVFAVPDQRVLHQPGRAFAFDVVGGVDVNVHYGDQAFRRPDLDRHRATHKKGRGICYAASAKRQRHTGDASNRCQPASA